MESMSNVRTRMAPSPTGEYHIGHIRTVLFNYALAKKTGGKFIIRIEDTDRERFVEGATERILSVIKDYGLSWDEGPVVGGAYAPYVQTERLEIYNEHVKKLLELGKAYYCFCSEERLTQMRDDQKALGKPTTKYDRACLNLSKAEIDAKLAAGEKFVIRLKVPDNRVITFHDLIAGDISINTNDLDDQVLVKSNGIPTYHFAVVVDDHLMEVSHVMRGSDWIPSTPKHVLLFEAFGWDLPVFIHLPNLKEISEGKKLSKRFGAVSALEFLQEGYLVEALLNFLMFLGWNPGTEREFFTLAEFVEEFSLARLQHEDLVSFDRNKLLWFNGQYLRKMAPQELLARLGTWAKKFEVELVSEAADISEAYKVKVLELVQDRLEKLSQYNNMVSFFYKAPAVATGELAEFAGSEDKACEIVAKYLNVLEAVADETWTEQSLDKLCHEKLVDFGYKPKEAFMTLRLALTGCTATPPLFAVMAILGKGETLTRLRNN